MKYYNDIDELQLADNELAEELLIAHDSEYAHWKHNGLRVFPSISEFAKYEFDKNSPNFEESPGDDIDFEELGKKHIEILSNSDVYQTSDDRVVLSDYVWDDGPNR